MAKPKKPAKDYLGRGRSKFQFLTPAPDKLNLYAPEGEEGWAVRPHKVPAKSRAVKRTASVRRKKK